MSGEDVEVYAETARRIWFRRNSVVCEGEFIHPNEVIRISTRFINDYHNALKKMGEGDFHRDDSGNTSFCLMGSSSFQYLQNQL